MKQLTVLILIGHRSTSPWGITRTGVCAVDLHRNQRQMNGLTRRRLGLFWLEAPQLVGVPVLEHSDLALADDLKLAEIGLARHVVEAGWYQSI